MSSRCGLLSICGDPFLLGFFIKLWQERWYDEIDKLYINLNNHTQVPVDIIGVCLSRLVKDPKVHLIYHPTGIGNGPPQVENLKLAKEDLVLLLEDDFFIFNSGAVNRNFKLIEEGKADIIGSCRYATGEVAKTAQKKYNLDYSGLGDKGFGWWPTGFFCKRADLLKTDIDFGSKKYPKGKYFKELDHTFIEDAYTDTFTWASIQLRYLGFKSIDIPHHHADPYEIQNKEAGYMNWHKDNQPFEWIHGGSLSAGWGGYLSDRIPDVSNDSAMQEMESRCAFWIVASDSIEGFNDFKNKYKQGIQNLIFNANLNQLRIEQKINIYKTLMKI